MADTPEQAPLVEAIPSRQGGVSALASAHAPFVYFDLASSFGFRGGVANITLEAVRHMDANGTTSFDRAVVAHLRTNAEGLRSLATALQGIALLMQPTEGEGGN